MKIPVCIFAKPPIPGRVKTRLAVSVGKEAAASLASAMLCDVWQTVVAVNDAQPVLAAAEPGQFPVDGITWLQGEGDLGSRMERIAQRGIAAAGQVILLGADSPELRPGHIEAALEQLKSHDAVIGPSFDGGYYLLGLSRCPGGLLHGLPWSTPETRAKTEERFLALNFRVATLAPLGDIDVFDDLLGCTAPGPHTAEWLRQWSASSSPR